MKPKVPKDLGLRIGSKTEVMWQSVLDAGKQALEQAEQTVIIQKELITLAARKVREEQRKGKGLNTK